MLGARVRRVLHVRVIIAAVMPRSERAIAFYSVPSPGSLVLTRYDYIDLDPQPILSATPVMILKNKIKQNKQKQKTNQQTNNAYPVVNSIVGL